MTRTKKLSDKEKREKQAALKVKRNQDQNPVKGIFRFNEVPGGGISFCYKAYDGDDVERYNLVDGQIYTLPLGVARHLNKSGKYPVHAYKMNEDNKPTINIGRMVSRYGFQSLEFMDIGDIEATGSSTIEEVVVTPSK
jgi:hypothetical protein